MRRCTHTRARPCWPPDGSSLGRICFLNEIKWCRQYALCTYRPCAVVVVPEASLIAQVTAQVTGHREPVFVLRRLSTRFLRCRRGTTERVVQSREPWRASSPRSGRQWQMSCWRGVRFGRPSTGGRINTTQAYSGHGCRPRCKPKRWSGCASRRRCQRGKHAPQPRHALRRP